MEVSRELMIELCRKMLLSRGPGFEEHTAETLAGSTLTITNLGMLDIDYFVPIINPPESAILAVGKIQKKIVVIHDAIAIRSMMRLCLTYDRRVLDGAVVARFLQAIKQTLEPPNRFCQQESEIRRRSMPSGRNGQ